MLFKKRSSVWLGISLIFLIIATVRCVQFAHHQPLLGLANNYDMLRLQSCHQIWPADTRFPPGTQSPDAPLEYYYIDATRQTGQCIPSSELVFTYIGEGVARLGLALTGDRTFSIRIFSYVRASFLLLSVFVISAYLTYHQHTKSACLNAAFAACALTDPGILIYLPTFYTEFSAVLGLYTALTAWYTHTVRPHTGMLILCLFGLALLGLSKFQHMLLPLTLAAGFSAPLWFWQKRRPLVALIALALAISLMQLARTSTQAHSSIRMANLTDTVLYTFVARAREPMQALEQLALPVTCAPAIGRSFYTVDQPIETFCPEIANASRLAVLGLYLSDAHMFHQINRDAFRQLRPWIPGHLGQVGEQRRGLLKHYVFTLDAWLDRIRLPVFALLMLGPLICTGVLLICVNPVHQQTQVIFTLLLTLQLATLEVFLVSLFGDGFADFNKHNHLLPVLVLSGYFVLAGVAYRIAQATPLFRAGVNHVDTLVP